MVAELLGDIEQYCAGESLEVILTLNLPEVLPFSANEYFFPLKIISNRLPMGFGENHNQAFGQAGGDFFCVLNPDIRIQEKYIQPLIQAMNESDPHRTRCAQVIDPNGKVEDSARKFPAPGEIFGKVFGYSSRRCPQGSGHIMYPDWVAGMFMLFPASVYRENRRVR
ncbi:MAG: glycosyltransferase [Nitrosomonadales bacterium]